jgi:solute carrier family 25 phosphate transporter 23/24/25/41
MAEKPATASVSSILIPFAAGSLSGVVTKTLTAPLERVKTLLQIEGMMELKRRTAAAAAAAAAAAPAVVAVPTGSAGAAAVGASVASGAAAASATASHGSAPADMASKQWRILRVVGQIYTRDGIRGFWYGNFANCLRVLPVYALKFGANDLIKDLVSDYPGQRLSFVQLIASGTLAGLVQMVITYPLETVRTRLTVGALYDIQYRGIWHCFYSTVKHEGVRGLYKGLSPTIWTGSPYVGLQMSCFEMIVRQAEARDTFGGNKTLQSVACGAVAGLFAQTVTYPGDTIRKRMQTDGIRGQKMLYRGMVHCTVSVARNEGFLTLFAGLGANIIRGIPGAGIQFAAFNFFKEQLKVLLADQQKKGPRP